MKSGLIVYVYRDAAHNGDCTNNGITNRFTSLTLLLPNGGPFEPTADRPALRLVTREIRGIGTYVHAVPVDLPAGQHSMFGGNYIATSDSRFPNAYPIPVHDRIEP